MPLPSLMSLEVWTALFPSLSAQLVVIKGAAQSPSPWAPGRSTNIQLPFPCVRHIFPAPQAELREEEDGVSVMSVLPNNKWGASHQCGRE